MSKIFGLKEDIKDIKDQPQAPVLISEKQDRIILLCSRDLSSDEKTTLGNTAKVLYFKGKVFQHISPDQIDSENDCEYIVFDLRNKHDFAWIQRNLEWVKGHKCVCVVSALESYASWHQQFPECVVKDYMPKQQFSRLEFERLLLSQPLEKPGCLSTLCGLWDLYKKKM
jgi:hypothetical protein